MKKKFRRILTYNIGDQEISEDVTKSPYSSNDIIRQLHINAIATIIGTQVKNYISKADGNIDNQNLGNFVLKIVGKRKNTQISNAKIELI